MARQHSASVPSACWTSPAPPRSTPPTSATWSSGSPPSAPARSAFAPPARPRTARWPSSQRRDARIGLAAVALEPVTVDGWRLEAARVEVTGGTDYECASMGGAPPTGERGVPAPLVDAGTGERRRLDRLDVPAGSRCSTGAAAQLAERDRTRARPARRRRHPPQLSRGRALLPVAARARVIRLALARGRTAFRDDVQGGRRRAGAAHRAAPLELRLTLRAELRSASGAQRRRLSAGRRGGAPIVVGAHHDGWFSAAFDNASGVAAVLALARALRIGAAGRATRSASRRARPRSTASPTAPKRLVHRRLGTDQRDASPLGRRLALPPQPRGQRPPRSPPAARGAARARGLGPAAGARWSCRGLADERLAREPAPVAGTELWPFLVSGVPGVSAYTWERTFMRTDYHTQYDTIATVDFAHLERLCRFYTFLLLDADADPGGILDHGARARDLARAAAALGDPGRALAAAAEAHGRRRGRAPSPRSAAGSARSTRTAQPPIPTPRPRATSRASRRRWQRSPQATGAVRSVSSRAWARTRSSACSRRRCSRSGASATGGSTRGPPGASQPPDGEPESVARACIAARRARARAARPLARAVARASPRAVTRRARAPRGRHGAGAELRRSRCAARTDHRARASVGPEERDVVARRASSASSARIRPICVANLKACPAPTLSSTSPRPGSRSSTKSRSGGKV